MKVGDRVVLSDYGPGTVDVVRPGLVGVAADCGGLWFRRPEDVQPVSELDRLEDNHFVSRMHDYPMGLWLREHPCTCHPDAPTCHCGDDAA